MITADSLIKLESLSLDCSRFSLKSTISQSKFQDVDLTIERVEDLNSDYLKFIQEDCLSRLAIKEAPLKTDEDQLADVFRHSSRLSHLEIGCKEECRSANNNDLEMEFLVLVKMATVDTLCKLESLKINCGGCSIDARFSQGKTQDVDLTIGRLDELNSDYLKFLQKECLSRLVIKDVPLKTDEHHLADVLRHSVGLTHLEIGCKEECRSAVNKDLEMDFLVLVKMTTVDILCKFESLKINYGELCFIARFSQGKSQDAELTIARLDEINSDYLEFIQKYHLSRLAIRYTPLETDEDQLTDILHSSPRLSQLQIGCKSERFLSITNLMITTREKIVQDRGSSSLDSIELMGENLVPFDIYGECDYNNTYIQSHLSFTEDSNSLGMRTWLRPRQGMNLADNDTVNNFIRQYDWSIVLFHEDETSKFAAILDDVHTTRDSQLESLRFSTQNLEADGFDRLDGIIKRSPNFKDLGLTVECNNENDFEKA
ncbi:hypothetical protein BGZ65_010772, partial [Modicella reniformis]